MSLLIDEGPTMVSFLASASAKPLRSELCLALILPVALLVSGFFTTCTAGSKADSASGTRWVGTWTTSPQLVETGNNPPAPGLANNTLRQVLRSSIGGDTLRLLLSNKFGSGPVTFHEVHIAVSTGAGAIDTTTDEVLHFGGLPEVTVAADTSVVSDPFPFALKPRMDVAVTISYGASPSGITGHPGSRTTSYLLTGNAVSKADFAGAVTTDHWYNINTLDVLAPSNAASVAILGNSITDGRGSMTNGQNRWPDVLSVSLLQDSATRYVGVLNAGIGGNCVLAGGLGPTGVSRYDRDIISQSGVRWAIVLEGVNDIGGVHSASAATTTAANLIAAYGQMIAKAHARNIRIYGATILPFGGNGYFNQYSEQCRSAVNQWIRTKGNFDACIDFDRLMRNPQDTTRILYPTNQNDGLHPDTMGYRIMGQSIDRNLFVVSDSTTLGVNSVEEIDGFALAQNYPNPFNPKTVVSAQWSVDSVVRLAVYDLLGREVAVLADGRFPAGKYSFMFDGSNLSSGMYIYRLTAGQYISSRSMTLLK